MRIPRRARPFGRGGRCRYNHRETKGESRMKLIGVDASPYVRKVRIVLEEKSIPYEYVRARPSVPGSPVPDYNPLAKVPVLVRDDGRGLYDSPVIVDYLDTKFPQPQLIPSALEARFEVKRWEALGDGIADATVLISHDYDKTQTADWHERQRLKLERGLATVEKDLAERRYCHGDSFTLADIATSYALAYLDRVLPEFDWRGKHAPLVRFYDRTMERESFRKTVPQT
jgi:glutathione S-transferase